MTSPVAVDSPWLDIAALAVYTRQSERTIHRAIAEGRIRSAQPAGRGGRRLIHRDWADAYLTAHAEGGQSLTGLAARRRRAS